VEILRHARADLAWDAIADMAIDFEHDHATHRTRRDFGDKQVVTGQIQARCHAPNSQARPGERLHIQVTTGNGNPSPFNCCAWLHA
jgi:hypothetical protein